MTKPVELEFLFIPFFTLLRSEVSPLWMPHILACVWFLLHQPPAQEGSIKKTERQRRKKSSSGNWPSSKGSDLRIWYCRLKRTPSWGRTLISTQSTSPQRSCATFVTQMMAVSLSLSFSTFSHFVIVFITFCFRQHTVSTSASSTFIF